MGDQTAPNTQGPKSAVVIIGLVLGIIALATSFLPIINNVSFFLALAGAVLAIIGVVSTIRGKRSGKGLAIASLVINIIAIVVVLATQSAYSSAIDEAVVDTSDGTAESQNVTEANANASSGEQAGNQVDASQYSITDETLSGDSYSATISGTFTNTSGKELSYVGVTYNLYDSGGNQIGNAYANTNNLADGGSWKFDAYCTESLSDIASFKLADVTAF